MSESLAKQFGIDEMSPTYLKAKADFEDRIAHGKADHSCPNGCVNYFDKEGQLLYGYGIAGCDSPICNGEVTPEGDKP